mgnify:CR=1 FL=1
MELTREENKRGSETVFIQNISDNYRQLEKSIVNQLKLYNEYHPYTTGALREDIWMQLFEMIVPKKFVIEHSIFIIDSYGQISREVDLAIIDNTYTPYIFRHGRMKFVPIEAIAAVVECKSTKISFKEKDKEGNVSEAGLAVWCQSIENLRTSRESVVRMATGTVVGGKSYTPQRDGKVQTIFNSTQTSTRPIRIFCGYETQIARRDIEKIKKCFDFVLLASDKDGKEQITVSITDNRTFKEWYKELNHYGNKENIKTEDGEEIEIVENEKLEEYHLSDLEVKYKEEKISLLSFNFQLNQLLMLINNPILFPHLGYAKLFNGELRKWDE